jgi:hypothetical protein
MARMLPSPESYSDAELRVYIEIAAKAATDEHRLFVKVRADLLEEIARRWQS